MSPGVSVVIPTKDRPGYLKECLGSIARQTHQPRQVIVVNDGGASVQDVVGPFKRIMPILEVNMPPSGMAAARNAAQRYVTHPVTCIMDDDDIMLPGRLEAHVRASIAGADVSYGGWINFSPDEEYAEFVPGKTWDLATLMQVGLVLTHGAIAVRSDLATEVQYNENYEGGADFDRIAGLTCKTNRFVHCEEFLILRRLHETRIGTRARASQRSVRQARLAEWEATLNTVEREQRKERAKLSLPPAGLKIPSIDAIARSVGFIPTIAEFLLNRTWPRFNMTDRMLSLAPKLGVRDPNPAGSLIHFCVPWSADNQSDIIEMSNDTLRSGGQVRIQRQLDDVTSVVCVRSAVYQSSNSCIAIRCSLEEAVGVLPLLSSVGQWSIYEIEQAGPHAENLPSSARQLRQLLDESGFQHLAFHAVTPLQHSSVA